MSFFAEIAPHYERIRQITDQIPGGIREGIFMAFGEIETGVIDLIKPDIGSQQIKRDKDNRNPLSPAITSGIGSPAPAFTIKRQYIKT